MQEIVKVAFVGIVGVLLALQFKGQKSEYSTYIGIALSILIFSFCIGQVKVVAEEFGRLGRYLGEAGDYLFVLLKVVGITYICEFSSAMCKDAGFQAVASQIEVLGKLSVMFAGLPILFAVIEQIQSFL